MGSLLMSTYEYQDEEGNVYTFKERLTNADARDRGLKRLWSFGIVWPKDQRGH